ncbi:MAG: hypothetical protein WC552_08080 [Candidatus Omnitrophota bacterium]
MKSLNKLVVICILCLLAGCSWLKDKRAADRPARQVIPVSDGRVVDEKRLGEGGNLLIVPFSAGVGVVASDELEGISLMIVKGIAEVLLGSAAPLKILDAQSAHTADLILNGHIVRKAERREGRKLFLGGKNRRLGVKGEVIDRKTGKVVAYFTNEKIVGGAARDYRALGQAIGQDIGRFLLSGLGRPK